MRRPAAIRFLLSIFLVAATLLQSCSPAPTAGLLFLETQGARQLDAYGVDVASLKRSIPGLQVIESENAELPDPESFFGDLITGTRVVFSAGYAGVGNDIADLAAEYQFEYIILSFTAPDQQSGFRYEPDLADTSFTRWLDEKLSQGYSLNVIRDDDLAGSDGELPYIAEFVGDYTLGDGDVSPRVRRITSDLDSTHVVILLLSPAKLLSALPMLSQNNAEYLAFWVPPGGSIDGAFTWEPGKIIKNYIEGSINSGDRVLLPFRGEK